MSVSARGFPREARLSGQQEFSAVFANGHRVSDRYFTILGLRNGLPFARLGLAISRKAARRATTRNRIKRLVRETFRHHQVDLAGLDMVVMVRHDAAGAERLKLRDALDRHCRELPGKCGNS